MKCTLLVETCGYLVLKLVIFGGPCRPGRHPVSGRTGAGLVSLSFSEKVLHNGRLQEGEKKPRELFTSKWYDENPLRRVPIVGLSRCSGLVYDHG